MKKIYHYLNQIYANDVWNKQTGREGWYDVTQIPAKGEPEEHYYYMMDDGDEPLQIKSSMIYLQEWTLGDDDYIQMY